MNGKHERSGVKGQWVILVSCGGVGGEVYYGRVDDALCRNDLAPGCNTGGDEGAMATEHKAL